MGKDKKNLKEKKNFRVFHMKKPDCGKKLGSFYQKCIQDLFDRESVESFYLFYYCKMIDQQAVRSYISQT